MKHHISLSWPNKLCILASGGILVITSCASMIAGSVGMNRSLTIASEPPGAIIYVNGFARGATPTVLMLSPYEIGSAPIVLRKPGYRDASFNARSGVKNSIYGNIIFGGVGGAIIDSASGNAVDTIKSAYIELKSSGD